MIYTLCEHCDHFVDMHDGGGMHLEDGEQEFDHDPVSSDHEHPLEDWKTLRPDLFKRHGDGKIGPNSQYHSRRGKVD